jgi:hypothetical protein
MFASLPNIADKNFIIGFFLPVLFAVLAALFLLRDTVAFATTIQAALDEKTVSAALLAMALWGGATLLFFLNYWQYRILEGYIGAGLYDRLGWRRKEEEQLQRIEHELSDLERAVNDEDAAEATKSKYARKKKELRETFPSRELSVLPTRFGNSIRAFETYARHVYGVGSIAVWLRLQAVIPKDFTSLVNDARTQVDFCVNMCFLSIAVALMAIARCVSEIITYGGDLQTLSFALPLAAVLAMATAWIAYEGAVASVPNWGDLVKSAFDLYLPALAKQLGYNLPATLAQRKAFWGDMTRMFLYWDSVDPANWSEAEAKRRHRRPTIRKQMRTDEIVRHDHSGGD